MLHQPSPAGNVVGRARLLGEQQPDVLKLVQRAGGFGGGPPAVPVDVELGIIAECLAQGPAGGDVELDRPPSDLDLEGGDAVLLAHAHCVVDHLSGGGEPDHVGGAHPVGVAAEQLGHRNCEALADQVPQRDIDRGPSGRVPCRTGHARVRSLAVQRRQALQLRAEEVLNHGHDAALRLAVGERPWRSVRGADQAVVGVDADQYMLGGSHLPAGEAQRLHVRN